MWQLLKHIAEQLSTVTGLISSFAVTAAMVKALVKWLNSKLGKR